jgi:hypothetical protein
MRLMKPPLRTSRVFIALISDMRMLYFPHLSPAQRRQKPTHFHRTESIVVSQ